MGLNVRANFVAVLAALSLLPGVATAAGAPAPADPKAGAWTPAPALVQEASTLPDQKKVDRSRESLARIRDAVAAVTRSQQEAKAAKDAIKLNCVEDKLTQVKGVLGVAEASVAALEGAAARKESSETANEYAKVAMAREKAEALQTEAAGCVGSSKSADGKSTGVDVEEPAGQMAVGSGLRTAPPPVTRPAAASPTN